MVLFSVKWLEMWLICTIAQKRKKNIVINEIVLPTMKIISIFCHSFAHSLLRTPLCQFFSHSISRYNSMWIFNVPAFAKLQTNDKSVSTLLSCDATHWINTFIFFSIQYINNIFSNLFRSMAVTFRRSLIWLGIKLNENHFTSDFFSTFEMCYAANSTYEVMNGKRVKIIITTSEAAEARLRQRKRKKKRALDGSRNKWQ